MLPHSSHPTKESWPKALSQFFAQIASLPSFLTSSFLQMNRPCFSISRSLFCPQTICPRSPFFFFIFCLFFSLSFLSFDLLIFVLHPSNHHSCNILPLSSSLWSSRKKNPPYSLCFAGFPTSISSLSLGHYNKTKYFSLHQGSQFCILNCPSGKRSGNSLLSHIYK